MFFRQTHCLVKILRRQCDVVVTIVSRLRARWKTSQSEIVVMTTSTEKRLDELEKRLESEVRFVTSLVSGIVENALPGRKVTIRARLKGDRQPALRFLNGQLAEPGKGD